MLELSNFQRDPKIDFSIAHPARCTWKILSLGAVLTTVMLK
jgi:hypothetical protein